MSRPCSVCRHPQRAEISLTLVAGTSYRTVADRFGLSKSALLRHRPHVGAGIVKTAATIVKDAARRDAEVREYDEASTLLQKIERLEADARRIGKRAEYEGDLRAALVANAGLLNVVKMLHELMPASETDPVVEVRFVFPDSGASRQDAAFETARASAGGAATARMMDGRGSDMPPGDEAAPPDVAHDARRVEESAVASEKARVSAPAPADPSPFQMLAPLAPGGRTR